MEFTIASVVTAATTIRSLADLFFENKAEYARKRKATASSKGRAEFVESVKEAGIELLKETEEHVKQGIISMLPVMKHAASSIIKGIVKIALNKIHSWMDKLRAFIDGKAEASAPVLAPAQ